MTEKEEKGNDYYFKAMDNFLQEMFCFGGSGEDVDRESPNFHQGMCGFHALNKILVGKTQGFSLGDVLFCIH